MRRLSLFAGACLFLGVETLRAQAQDQKGKVLAGIREVQVAVNDSPECDAAGLNGSRAKVEVELALRRMGMRVVPRASVEFRAVMLCWPVKTKDASDTLVVFYTIEGRIREWVQMNRFTKPVSILVPTYETITAVGHFAPAQKSDILLDRLREVLANFENDWLAANPNRR